MARIKLVVLVLSFLVLLPQMASATSTSSELQKDSQNTLTQCKTPSSTRLKNCESASIDLVASPVVSEAVKALAAVRLAANFTNDPTSLAVQLVGALVTQYNRLTGLVASVAIGGAPGKPAGTQVNTFATNQSAQSPYYQADLTSLNPLTRNGTYTAATTYSYDDSLNGFEYTANVPLYWNPQYQSCHCLDGKAQFVSYHADPQPSSTWDFSATSQWASVTPTNGKKLTGVQTFLRPSNGLEVINANPKGSSDETASGSYTIGASIKGEAGIPGLAQGGAEVNIARTYNYYKGTAGGGVLSDDSHYCFWSSNGGGEAYPKSDEGVATWKSANGNSGYWGVGATAWAR